MKLFDFKLFKSKIQKTISGQTKNMNDHLKTAADMVKDPTSYSTLTYLWVLFLSICGGVVRVIRECQIGTKTWRELVFLFITECIVSAFIGVITFYLCESADFKPLYTAVMISISSYMGGRSLAVFEWLWKSRMPKMEP